MRRLSTALLLLLIWSPVWAAGLLQFGAAPWQTYYYVNAATGSDSNAGTSPALAWATLHKVNNSVFAANSVVFLQGSFSGGDNGLIITTTVAPSGKLTITTYGAGATINSGNSTACVTATDVPSFKFTGVACVGGGNLTNTTAGISVVNDQSGNTSLAGPTISGITVSGYGSNCIEIKGTSGTSGFNGVDITRTTAHDCTGNVLPETVLNGSSCITGFSGPASGTTSAFSNVSITYTTVYNCTGIATATATNGNGVTFFQVNGLTMKYNVARDIGTAVTSCGGAGAFWTQDATNADVEYNEAYHIHHGSGGCDGDGFDLDVCVTNSIVAHNYAHDNDSYDYLTDPGSDGFGCSAWGNNTIAWNIGQLAGLGELALAMTGNATGALYAYNNTFYCVGSGTCFLEADSGTQSATIANNIFIGLGGADILKLTTTSSIDFLGNDYVTTTGVPSFNWGGTTYSTFAAWQSASGQEKINGSNVGLTVNPQIYVPGGGWANGGYVPANLYAYNLQAASPMIGAGQTYATLGIPSPILTDYYGVAVSAGSPPVGAANGDFGTFVASCTPTSNYLARVSSFTKLDEVNYNSLLCGENSDGDLPLIDVENIWAAPNHAAALLNLVSNNHNSTENGTVTFSARVGITGDASTGYEDPAFTPSTAAGNYTQNIATVGGYLTNSRTTVENWNILGATDTTNTYETNISPYTTGPDVFADVNSEIGTEAGSTNAQGQWLAQRLSTTSEAIYKNGASVKLSTTDTTTSLLNNKLLIAAETAPNGTAENFSGDTFAASVIGGAISPLNVSNRINSFMQAYGINVY
jgi:hypothetical protein